jgi:pyruvyltransferase
MKKNRFFWTLKRTVKSRKKIISKNMMSNTLRLSLGKEKQIVAYWWTGDGGNNWGDALNPILIQNLSGKKPILSEEVINLRNQEVYSVIGSILGATPDKNLVVWGSGFISSSSRFKMEPRKIYAVRGPLTRKLIIDQGIDCPKIYGDPALLYPLFYKPNIKKKYKMGIVPHFTDQNNPLLDYFKKYSDILIINILSGINEVVDEICSCEMIASSSLHGIIAADAYGVPSIWVEFSDNVRGSGFKFYDYFESVGRINEKPFRITENTTIQDIRNESKIYKLDIDLGKLIDVCPFLNRIEINSLKKRLKRN